MCVNMTSKSKLQFVGNLNKKGGKWKTGSVTSDRKCEEQRKSLSKIERK